MKKYFPILSSKFLYTPLKVVKEFHRMLFWLLTKIPGYRKLPLYLQKGLAVSLTVLIFFSSISSIFLYSPLFRKPASAAWADDNWAYRTSYSINNTGAADSNKKIKFDIDTASLTTDKLQADCGDSRFTDQGGNILKYYIDEAGGACDGVSTDYYVLVPTINAGRTIIYHYYGNPSAQNGTEASQFSEATFSPASSTAASEEKGTGPVAYWKFDDGTGTNAQDATQNNLDGTLSGAAWQTEDMCISGKCLKFDGADDRINLGNPSALSITGTTITVSAWIKTLSSGSAEQAIITRRTQGNGTQYTLRLLSTNYLCFDWDDSSSVYKSHCDTTTALSTNTWYFVAATYNGSQVVIYVNGKAVITFSETAALASKTNNNYIGFYDQTGNNSWFKGFIDEPKIYNYALTAAQVLANFNSRSNPDSASASFSQTPNNNFKALNDGLVGYWKMDESSGNLTDSSGNGFTGTVTGTTVAAGKFGNGRTFNGSSHQATVSDNNSLDLTTTVTLSAWVKTSATNDYSGMIDKFQDNANNGYAMEFNTSGGVRGDFGNGTTYIAIVSSGVNVEDNNWHHIVTTYDGKTGIIYVDGVQRGSAASSIGNMATNTQSLVIGNYADIAGRYLNGSLDEARVYNRALSPAEVSSLYNFAPGPVGYWDFEDTSSTTITDRSGNGASGTWNGTSTKRYTQGKFGRGGNFVKANVDYVNITGANIPSRQGTVSAWVYPTAGGTYDILGAGIATNDFRLSPGNNLYGFYISAEYRVSYATDPTVNSWTYITLTWDQTSGSILYYNGVKVASNSTPPPAFTQTGFQMGRVATAPTEVLTGTLDDVRIYNYARTQKQIVEDMNAGHPSVGSPVGSAVGHWKFDEGQGTTANNSGSQGSTLNGTLTNMASPATSTSGWTQAGKFGRGLVFDGSNDWISIANNVALRPTNVSVSAWVNLSSTADGKTIVAKEKGAGQSYMLTIGVANAGYLEFCSYNGAWYCAKTASSGLTTSTWYHLVGTYDGTNLRLYINGVLKDTATLSSIDYTSSDILTIGRYYAAGAGGNYFNGSIDEPKIYPYALTTDEVKLEYNRGSNLVLGALSDNSSYQPQAANQEYCIPGDSTSCAAPVGRWDFEEGTGTSAYDTSGNGRTGTLTGGPTWSTGKNGKGINLDGSNDYVNIGTTSNFQSTTGVTLEMWVKFDSFQGNNELIANYDGGNFVAGDVRFYYGDGPFFVAQFGQGNSVGLNYYTSASGFLSTGRWYHLAASYDESRGTDAKIKLYVDGIEQAINTAANEEGNGGTIFNNGTTLKIGTANYASPPYIDGKIDQVRLFNYARTAAQIAWDYNRGAPVGHWKFDEGQGATANDSSGNSNSGTITIGGTGTQTSAGDINTSSTAWFNGKTGKRNYSLNFDGTDDYVSMGTPSTLDMDGAMTVSAWVYVTTAGVACIVCDATSGGLSGQYQLHFQGTDGTRLRFGWGNGTTADNIDTDQAVQVTNQWMHVAATRDSSKNVVLYVDGKQVKSATGSVALYSSPRGISIGRNGAASAAYFPGQIDDVRIYNYALTPLQIKLLYNNGAINFGPSTGAP